MTGLTIREAAKQFVPNEMKHICELQEFSIDLMIQSIEKKNQKGEVYTQLYAEIDNKRYQVPGKVLEIIQGMIALKPEIKKVRAIKSGTGAATRYKVEVVA